MTCPDLPAGGRSESALSRGFADVLAVMTPAPRAVKGVPAVHSGSESQCRMEIWLGLAKALWTR
jgi:hypothetical protein